jgi:hypothetical protein
MLVLPLDKSHATVPLKVDIKETALAPAVITWKRRNLFANTSRLVRFCSPSINLMPQSL